MWFDNLVVRDLTAGGVHTVLGATEGVDGRTLTDAEGRFTMELASPGNYLISAQAEGYARRTLEEYLSAGSDPLLLMLEPGGVVDGRVVNTRSGEPDSRSTALSANRPASPENLRAEHQPARRFPRSRGRLAEPLRASQPETALRGR